MPSIPSSTELEILDFVRDRLGFLPIAAVLIFMTHYPTSAAQSLLANALTAPILSIARNTNPSSLT